MSEVFWTEKDFKLNLQNLLIGGRITGSMKNIKSELISYQEVDLAISLLNFVANENPQLLLDETAAISISHQTMVSLALAMLMGGADEEYIKDKIVKERVFFMLSQLEPDQLVEFIEYLQCKILGRGFGSRPQKIVKKIMESWDSRTIEHFIYHYEIPMKYLIKAVHPKYKGYRGELIKVLLDNEL